MTGKVWAIGPLALFLSALMYFHGLDLQLEEIDYCPLGTNIRPSDYNSSSVEFIINDAGYKQDSAAKLSGAVQHETVSNDGTTLGTINGTKFLEFHAYLAHEFPLVHEQVGLEKINHYGLVYTWQGSDNRLKPLLFTAHQDTVPVDKGSRHQWLYDPFEGYYDGVNIWGRGSSDCKSMVIGQLQAVEKLLEEGYSPKRTVILAFGFDEEIGGRMGAIPIAKHLYQRYGKYGIYSLLDEGGTAMAIVGGTVVAQPAVGEKGALALNVALTTPGGHSSIPPAHTNIGIQSKLISLIEDNPFPQIMEASNPTLKYMECIAQHTDALSPSLRSAVFRATSDYFAKKKVFKYLESIKELRFLVQTTQAVDIIHGGVKSNALPEFTAFDINHRISVESSADATAKKIRENVLTIAGQFDLGVYYQGEEFAPKTPNGYFNVTSQGTLEPARVSPLDAEPWFLFQGSVKHIIEDIIYPNITNKAVVAPSLNTGNTDTSHYWDLTENIYRYRLSTMHGITEGHTHSVNEHTTIENHLYLVAFSYEYIKNVNEYAAGA